MQLVDVYRARIVDVSPDSLVIETTGTEDKIDSLLEVLRPYGVVEMVRTGRVEMVRGTGMPRRARQRRAPMSSDWTTRQADRSNQLSPQRQISDLETLPWQRCITTRTRTCA